MIVCVLAVDACRMALCHNYQACVINEGGGQQSGQPVCRCPTPTLCDDNVQVQQPICATNRQTYANRCLLRVAECEAGRSIPVLRRGACRY